MRKVLASYRTEMSPDPDSILGEKLRFKTGIASAMIRQERKRLAK